MTNQEDILDSLQEESDTLIQEMQRKEVHLLL